LSELKNTKSGRTKREGADPRKKGGEALRAKCHSTGKRDVRVNNAEGRGGRQVTRRDVKMS